MRAVFPEMRYSIFFCLLRLYLYLWERPFSHTKSKASECEQLILASTPGKTLRRFWKDNDHLEKFDTYYKTFANDKRILQCTTAVKTISLCVYMFIVLIEYQGWSLFKDF